jgi:hypothetical protein
MSGRHGGGGGGGQRGRVLLPPINFIFRLLQQRSQVSIWLSEQVNARIEGKIRVRRAAFDALSSILTGQCRALTNS